MSDTPENPNTPTPPTPPVPPVGGPGAGVQPTVPIPPSRPAEPVHQTGATEPLPPVTPGFTPPAAAFGPTAAPHPAGTPAPRRRTGVIVAAIAVAAIVGGAAGAGVATLVDSNGSHGTPTSAAANPTTITVNNPDEATTVTAVAAKASPSVVTISVATSSESGTGSGVILTKDGYILTNTHVVTLDGASSTGTIKVTLNDGHIYSAKVIGTDPISDLAVVKIDATDLQPAEFADSSKLNVGDTAIAIGAPLGLSGTVTDGIVSALNRSITIASSAVPDNSSQGDSGGSGSSPFDLWGFDLPGQNNSSTSQPSSTISLAVIQTDAAINPGNSGGALLNAKGEVIGINVAIASANNSTDDSTQSGSIGVGFSIPANLASRVAKEIMATGSATHGLLGASIVNDTDSSGNATSNQSVVGAVIQDVTAGSAADKAGLKSGDIITAFNGVPVTDYTDLIAQVRALAAGSTATLTYVRDGDSIDAQVTLGALK